jgi:hypothetical protein
MNKKMIREAIYIILGMAAILKNMVAILNFTWLTGFSA